MTARQQFSPLCDVHHTSMQRLMLEEDPNPVRSYHACNRSGCTRIFRDSDGYSDMADNQFDSSRAEAKKCPVCGSALYLAEVDHVRKVETWECPSDGCEGAEVSEAPAAR